MQTTIAAMCGRDVKTQAFQRNLCELARDEQVRPERGREESHFVGDHEQNPEMDRIDAELNDDRQQNRCDDDDRRQGLHEHPEDEECENDYEKDRERIGRDGRQQFCEPVGRLVHGQDLAEYRGGGDDNHGGGNARRLDQRVENRPEIEHPVDDAAYEQSVEDRNHRCFYRREHASIDSAENEERRGERELALPAGACELP